VTDHCVAKALPERVHPAQSPRWYYCCVCDAGPIDFHRTEPLALFRPPRRRNRRRRAPPEETAVKPPESRGF
jgi:hypothetical protein